MRTSLESDTTRQDMIVYGQDSTLGRCSPPKHVARSVCDQYLEQVAEDMSNDPQKMRHAEEEMVQGRGACSGRKTCVRVNGIETQEGSRASWLVGARGFISAVRARRFHRQPQDPTEVVRVTERRLDSVKVAVRLRLGSASSRHGTDLGCK